MQQPFNSTEASDRIVPMNLQTPDASTVDRMVRTQRAMFQRVLAQWTGDLLLIRARGGASARWQAESDRRPMAA